MSFLFINKILRLNNLKTRRAINAKISMSVVCVETIIYLLHIICITVTLSSCYRTVPSAIWEIISEFLIFCDLFHEPLSEWNNSKIWETRKIFPNRYFPTRQRVITTLSLNACLNKMYQELSYLLIVSSLLNII